MPLSIISNHVPNFNTILGGNFENYPSVKGRFEEMCD